MIRSFIYFAAAAEALADGVDISKLSKQDFVSIFKGKKGEYRILIDKDIQALFDLKSNLVLRKDNAIYLEDESKKDSFTPNLTLDFDKAKEIMTVLYLSNLEMFSEIPEEKYMDNYKELVKNLDKDFIEDAPMITELSRDKTDEWLKIFLALFNYEKGYSKKLYDDSKLDKEFHLTKAKDFDIIDNRLYFWIKPSLKKKILKTLSSDGVTVPSAFNDVKAFVISKNVYDYFWASYGNSFQSCFSLSSEYGYLYGYVPFAMAPESFICYATTGGVNKIPIISGKQFKCPNMLFRCWGYADEDGNLLVDKRYFSRSFESEKFVQYMLTVITPYLSIKDDCLNNQQRTLYDDGKNIAKIFSDLDGYFYSDSLRISSDKKRVSFDWGHGTGGTGHTKYPWSSTHSRFTDYASTITQVMDNLTLDKPFNVVNGVLMNPKTCPVTGFYISEEESKSPFAKFYTTSCKSSAMITYVGGQVFLDSLAVADGYVSSSKMVLKQNYSNSNDRRGFYNGCLFILPYSAIPDSTSKSVTLKTVKEIIKGDIDRLNIDGILLRYFEGHEVKYQFYKHREK